LITAAAVVLIPRAPLILITLFVQVIAVTLLPAALTFLILLLNNAELMGKYKNTGVQNILGFTVVVAIVILSTLYSVSVVFPGLFK
jgi:Mn2+/Fe2+ NRAMP family transporter